MNNLRKGFGASEQILVAACVLAFMGMFVLGIATVVFRFLLDSSLAFPDELIRYLFVWMIFLGSAVAYRRNIHATIGALVGALPEPAQRLALLAATLATGIFGAVILVAGFDLTIRAIPQISPALEVSMAWVYAAVPVGMAFLILYAIEIFVRQLRAPVSDFLGIGE